jgi:OFA family oxalate/formate antiporter-like MFS transporter
MLCLGGVYAWSILAPELKREYGFSTSQVQLIFGVLIAVFPGTMIIGGRLENKLKPTIHALISAFFFITGYLISGYSGGNFLLILLGTGVFAGIGTGFGYLAALTTPVKWFPEKKGLVTGIAAAGFGLAAVILSSLIEKMFISGMHVSQIFVTIGLLYGSIILIVAFGLKSPGEVAKTPRAKARNMLRDKHFYKLLAGVFAGTFAGLLVIGNLSSIGAEYQIDSHMLVIGVSVFAVANFAGRLSWGFLSDYFDAQKCIVLALLFQGAAIFLAGYLSLTPLIYILLSGMIGFGFGSNFVLFAKDTSRHFGSTNLGIIYPYIFLGYAVAGIFGPLTGGLLFDLSGSFHYANYVAAGMSAIGAVLFVFRKKG